MSRLAESAQPRSGAVDGKPRPSQELGATMDQSLQQGYRRRSEMSRNTQSSTTEYASEKNCYQKISLEELMRGSTKVYWVLEPFVAPSTALMIFGDSGVGKTWLVCDLALALASGGKWLGHFQAKQQTVLEVSLISC